MAINQEDKLDSYVSRTSLLDELTKIGEEAEKKRSLGPALKAMGIASAGGALGYGAAELLAHKVPFFQAPKGPDQAMQRATMAKVLLPILSGTAAMLADRYRKKMNDEYSKVKGYNAK